MNATLLDEAPEHGAAANVVRVNLLFGIVTARAREDGNSDRDHRNEPTQERAAWRGPKDRHPIRLGHDADAKPVVASRGELVHFRWRHRREVHDASVAARHWDERWGRFYELLAAEKPKEALASLDSFAENELTNVHWIYCYMLAGDKQKALDMLEDLFRRHSMTLPQILTDAILDPLSDEPRVVEFRRSMGLAP